MGRGKGKWSLLMKNDYISIRFSQYRRESFMRKEMIRGREVEGIS